MAENGFGFDPARTMQVKESIDKIVGELSKVNSDLKYKCGTMNAIVMRMNDGETFSATDDFDSQISALKKISEDLKNKVDEFYKTIGVIKNGEIDYSSYLAGGGFVYTNAYDAVEGTNGLAASTYFAANPVDVYNTETGEYLHLTQDQLNDIGYLTELAENPNYALLLGNSVEDASGFIPLNGLINNITITTNKNGFSSDADSLTEKLNQGIPLGSDFVSLNKSDGVESLQHKLNQATSVNSATNGNGSLQHKMDQNISSYSESSFNSQPSSENTISSEPVESLQHKLNQATPVNSTSSTDGNTLSSQINNF